MKHKIKWIKKHCEPFVTYDEDFQIWKRKDREEYWAYDVDEDGFVLVELIARETFSEDTDDDELMCKYENDWCGEVDNSFDIIADEKDENNAIEVFDYAWFERVEGVD